MSIENTKAAIHWAIVRAEKAPFFKEQEAWSDTGSALYGLGDGLHEAIAAFSGLRGKVETMQGLSGQFNERAVEIHEKVTEVTAGSASSAKDDVVASAAELRKATDYHVMIGAKVLSLVNALEGPMQAIAGIIEEVERMRTYMDQEGVVSPSQAQQEFIERATEYRDSL